MSSTISTSTTSPSPSPPRSNRFQSFTPLRQSSASLRRLKTAFSPSRSLRSSTRSISPSSSSTCTTSPLSRNASPHSYRSASSTASIRQILALRRKPSVFDFEMEDEMRCFGSELGVLEPRPVVVGFSPVKAGMAEVHVVGIFEVLDGKF